MRPAPPGGITSGGGQGETNKEIAMRKKRDIIVTAVFGLIFLAGLSVMLYPTFANWWNTHMASHAVTSYKEQIAKIDSGETERIFAEAHEYNKKLAQISCILKVYPESWMKSAYGLEGHQPYPES